MNDCVEKHNWQWANRYELYVAFNFKLDMLHETPT